ncbi:Fis family transcriptional regulator [Teredinibacter waterburyi]|uniref:Fis family transcriptional regulator n=1 Tax=Teredinibacter waterburyi TaxID=1500538 RepID=UPI00165F2943|nr:Fis family transcriptional regulator [Teredinibacter waterburyi]
MAKAQSKTQKKIDANIRNALTDLCENSFKTIDGFQWLTHQADFANFPASLLITCVFESQEQLTEATNLKHCSAIKTAIQARLLKIGVRFKTLDRQVQFDTEEACIAENNHDWPLRLAKHTGRAVPHSTRP